MKSLMVVMTMALAIICANGGFHSSGSYDTDSFLKGIGRLAASARAQGNMKFIASRGCNLSCPTANVCSLQYGAPRCVPIQGNYGYNQQRTFVTERDVSVITNSVNELINAFLVFARQMSVYQIPFGGTNGFTGTNACGYMPSGCRAVQSTVKRIPKFTFDFTMKRCIQVDVCSSCAQYDGARFNVFGTQNECQRSCQ